LRSPPPWGRTSLDTRASFATNAQGYHSLASGRA
jgi:hypothetical protein